jgi:hypothetical protein
MNETRLLQLVETLLGSGKKQGNKGDFLFYCSACSHYKRKLSVNLDSSSSKFGKFACWICQDYSNTKGKSLWALFKLFKATPVQLDELSELLGEKQYTTKKDDTVKKILALPSEYTRVWGYTGSPDDLDFRRVVVYLSKRGITWGDIIKYQIGFCKSGDYKGRIIIPSYDENNRINFFSARSYYEDAYLKYKNPEASKDIIGFENMINWNMAIVLCEGVFDAIAIRRNAIPLFGKTVMGNLRDKILINRPPKIYISLDRDALKNSVVIAEMFIKEGIETYIVKLGDKDPANIGFEKMTMVIKNQSTKIDFSTLTKYKVGLV